MQVIAQIVQHLKPGGIEKLAIDMMKFKQQGTEVFVIALEGDKESCLKHWPELNSLQTQLIFINKPAGFSLRIIWQLRCLLKKLQVTCIHTHHIGPLLYGGLATLALTKIKHIHTEHDAWHLTNSKQQVITRWMLRFKPILLVADAETVANELPKHLGKLRRLDTIVNGIDTTKFKPLATNLDIKEQPTENKTQIIVGCAARLVPEKSLSILIESIAEIDNCQLKIAGDGPEKQALIELTESLGLMSRVEFIGHTDDMVSFYQSIDIFVLTSQHEGLPLSLLEAQACGVPVICSDVGAVWEGVCKDTGQLVSEHSALAFAHALRQQISAKLDTSPRSFIVNRFDIHQMVNAYNNLN